MERGSFAIRRCVVKDVQALEAHSRHVFPRHTHEEYGIGLIVSGAHRSWSGRGLVEAGRGSLITCNPGEVHDGAPIGETRAWTMLYLAPHLVGAIADDILEGAATSFEFTDPVIERRDHAATFKAAYRALTRTATDTDLAQERLIVLLAGLLHRKPPSSHHASAALMRAKARIDDDPSASISLAELAHVARASRFQVIRGFEKLIGLTPHAYLVQRRLDAARAMIAGGSPLADTAAKCGFADQSHFNRAFASRYGVTPGAYAEATR